MEDCIDFVSTFEERMDIVNNLKLPAHIKIKDYIKCQDQAHLQVTCYENKSHILGILFISNRAEIDRYFESTFISIRIWILIEHKKIFGNIFGYLK